MDPIERMQKLLAPVCDQLGKEPSDRDEKVLAGGLEKITAWLGSDEAKGYEATDEFGKQIAQLRKDLDAQTEQLRKIQKAGLQLQDRRLKVLGHEEITNLRRVQRVFAYKDQAEGFGALAARALWGKTPVYADVVAQRTREMAESLTKDLDPGVSTAGAELVANLYMADMIAHVETVGVLFTQCDRVPLQTIGSTIWPKLTGELTAYPTAVAAKLTESEPAFTTVTLTPVKWGTLTPVPNEFFRNPTLLDALGQRLAWLITRAIAYAFDNAMVNGDGTADYGTITGLLQDANITAVSTAHATAATQDGADVGTVIAGMSKDYVSDPRWWMSLSMERTLRNIRSTTGMPIYQRGSNGEPNTIDDYPYTVCQRFPAASAITDADLFCAFGDLRLSHFFGMLGGIEIGQSEHVRFEHDMTVVRGIAMADAALKDGDAVITGKSAAA